MGSLGKLRKCLNRRRSLKSILLAQLACIILVYLSTKTFILIRSQSKSLLGLNPLNFLSLSSSRVKIGIVVCTGEEFNLTTNNGPVEATTLIKSVVISAKLYNFVGEVEFHIFYDHPELPLYFKEVIGATVEKTGMKDNFTFHLHNVFSSLAPENVESFVKVERPCAFLRIFFPEMLSSLDKILYLDTDTVITGNIGVIWNSFPQTLVALAQNNEVEDGNHLDVDGFNVGDIPHVTPKGVNSGVMYMNLEGLRKADFTRKLLNLYENSITNSLRMTDQRLINIALHANPSWVEILPCHFNFQYLHCDKGLTCMDAEDDPTGIQIMHGTADSFHKSWFSHHYIFKAYAKFDLDAKEGLIEGLIKPLKTLYMEENSSATCNQTLGPLLFKDLT